MRGLGLYTSSVARFSANFLWYSYERPVTVSSTAVRWTSCADEPGFFQACSLTDIQDGAAARPVLRAYNFPSSVTLSTFEFGGVWIAKACGNHLATAERPDPVPSSTATSSATTTATVYRTGANDAAGLDIRVSRVRSDAGEGTGLIGTPQTDSNGYYRFNLKDHGPGRYRVREVIPADWKIYTAGAYEVEVEHGVGDRGYRRDFGDAQTRADVAKTSIQVVSPTAHLDVNTARELAVSVTIENRGLAVQVDVEDGLTAVLPADCSTQPTQSSGRSFGLVSPRPAR